VEGLKKKNKRLEQKKKNYPKPKVSPKAVPSSSKKKVKEPIKETPKSTTTPAPPKTKIVWMPKEKPIPTPPGMENPSIGNQ
jgi:hypothetical protein